MHCIQILQFVFLSSDFNSHILRNFKYRYLVIFVVISINFHQYFGVIDKLTQRCSVKKRERERERERKRERERERKRSAIFT